MLKEVIDVQQKSTSLVVFNMTVVRHNGSLSIAFKALFERNEIRFNSNFSTS